MQSVLSKEEAREKYTLTHTHSITQHYASQAPRMAMSAHSHERYKLVLRLTDDALGRCQSLAHRVEAIVALLVETRGVCNLDLGALEAGVSLHDGFRGVIEADLVGGFEVVFEKLETVGLLDLHALTISAKLVFLEYVVLRTASGVRRYRLIGPDVGQYVVSEHE